MDNIAYTLLSLRRNLISFLGTTYRSKSSIFNMRNSNVGKTIATESKSTPLPSKL